MLYVCRNVPEGNYRAVAGVLHAIFESLPPLYHLLCAQQDSLLSIKGGAGGVNTNIHQITSLEVVINPIL
jgi:hypothetical protein